MSAVISATTRKRQGGPQPRRQPARCGAQHRRSQRGARGLGLRLRELLRQQLVELQALPGRVTVVFQGLRVQFARRVVQQLERIAQGRQPGRHGAGRQQFVQRCPGQAREHGLAQIGLRQLRAGRVDGRQRLRQRGFGGDGTELGVHHLAAEEAAAHLAAGAHRLAHGQRLQVRGVEVQQPQQHLAAVVGQAHEQLAA